MGIKRYELNDAQWAKILLGMGNVDPSNLNIMVGPDLSGR